MAEEKKGKKPAIRFSKDLVELLSRVSEIELDDVELNIGDLEISLQPSISASPAIPALKPVIQERVRPTKLLEAEFKIPRRQYLSQIVEVKIGATKREGGTRGRTVVIGGEKVPPYYLFEASMPHKPVIGLDVFDLAPPLASAMKAPFKDVLDDPAEWAKRAVDKYGAEMINLHLTSIDPLIKDTSPEEAAKTLENVLQAVDVPLSVGGCGDKDKDLKVFRKVAEVGKGERLLFNSVTLDMDIKKMAEVVGKHGHTVIAFTSMDMAQARELNRKLYDAGLPKESIIIDTTTAALGYGLDYAFSVMERTRLSGLMGDPELQHPISSGTTNAWAAREAWMKMAPEWGPRELRGPIWETVTATTLLLAGVDYFMMMHPAAVKTVKDIINELLNGHKANSEKIVNWVSTRI
ncbi:CO dehydrogenase/acetyl-CoA synthase subunit delta [Candidatus Bathyarchaeota archaeon]|nr:CO dehydrogenase/acetyl-CoA synthase subunit delta [Candidatus Bathyarchaeota archaeon]